ncbi:MAG: hypothetical protein A3G95_06840 [Flavobacteria bacterium RIFCSPLOWO2_12_FULL_31_7]|nr:MAG: hypothetical protein A3G95_06840 [Flavobacteria bacterium RIFCSPLOWO2_12_FULL_31_7]
MKRFLLNIIGFLFCMTSFGQIHELGVFVGGSNYIGDVGKTDYLAPNDAALGILYKWNKSTRHSWRFSYTQTSITAKDIESNVPSRNLRGYEIKNNIKELSAGLEFNFFDFDLHQEKFVISPYVYSGLSTFLYNETYVLNKVSNEDYQHYSFAIPMIIGVKAKIANHLVLGLETGARYTFTDNLDGSNPKNENFETLKFGNLNNKDWYVFTGFTLTYTFGKNPCFCTER